jgi:Tetracyclin repressor-like, C-terminal domain
VTPRGARLLTAVIGAITEQVEQVLRDAVDPAKGLAAAIHDAVQVFWQHVLADDGLQLMQYELTIHCRRTPGLEWLAVWQYARYITAVTEVLGAAAEHDASPSAISLDQLVRFLVAAVDGLVLQYTVHQDAEQSQSRYLQRDHRRHRAYRPGHPGRYLAEAAPATNALATSHPGRCLPGETFWPLLEWPSGSQIPLRSAGPVEISPGTRALAGPMFTTDGCSFVTDDVPGGRCA